MTFLTQTPTRHLTAPSAPRFPMARMVATWRQRRALAALDHARLADLGLTEGEALRESRRPVWDLPR
jgi:uncharacterized protein YjiS (DUF1127 family)